MNPRELKTFYDSQSFPEGRFRSSPEIGE